MSILCGALRVAALMVLPLSLSACDWMKKKDPPGAKTQAELRQERAQRLRRACASQATYDRLKELAFDEAARIRDQDPRALDALAEASVVRMEEPVVKSRDEDLNVTVCTGQFILELPPGAENAFDGQRRLAATIEYAAQAAVDGSGLVYQMSGAEPIVYRLATVGAARPVRSARREPPPAEPAPVVTAEREPLPAPGSEPAPEPRPRPEPKPDRAPTPEPRARPAAAKPSFNCAYARTRSEKMVCASPVLAAQDRRMSSLFYSALADADGEQRRVLRRSRDRFLAFRERCDTQACVSQAYDDRMDEIRDIMR